LVSNGRFGKIKLGNKNSEKEDAIAPRRSKT